MLASVAKNFRSCWRTLLATDLMFKAIVFIFLAPLVSLLFRVFLATSGRSVLADTDIALFLIHPIGWLTLVIVGAAVLACFALELALLVTICLGTEANRSIGPATAFGFVLREAPRLWHLAARIVWQLALTSIPFLAVAGGLFWFFLTENDINFYLTDQPPEFKLAVGLIGITLAAMTAVSCYRMAGWIFAAPIVVIEDSAPKSAMAKSIRLANGHRKQIFSTLACWATFNLLLRFVLSLTVVFVSQQLVSYAIGSLGTLVIALGLMILFVSASNLLGGIIGNTTLASCISILFANARQPDTIKISSLAERPAAFGNFLTRGRVLWATVILLLGSGFFGLSMLRGIRLQDDVEVTAHRGGAFDMPENTIAAIQRAIGEGADWIEIDVQESSDGVVMVIHDSDLKKVGGNPVKIWDATAEQLRDIDIGSYVGQEFSSERVPTLDEVLKACHGKVGVNIELKYYGHDQDLEQRVVDLVEANEMSTEVVLMSLKSQGIAKIKKLRPSWTVGLLTAVAAGDLTRADADFLAVKDSLATSAFVQSAHRHGKSVSAWTLNDPHSMSLMISRGVDNLITDRPALARRVIAERSLMSPVERLTLEVGYYLGVKPDIAKYRADDEGT